jgi:hypothetical protein
MIANGTLQNVCLLSEEAATVLAIKHPREDAEMGSSAGAERHIAVAPARCRQNCVVELGYVVKRPSKSGPPRTPAT